MGLMDLLELQEPPVPQARMAAMAPLVLLDLPASMETQDLRV